MAGNGSEMKADCDGLIAAHYTKVSLMQKKAAASHDGVTSFSTRQLFSGILDMKPQLQFACQDMFPCLADCLDAVQSCCGQTVAEHCVFHACMHALTWLLSHIIQ